MKNQINVIRSLVDPRSSTRWLFLDLDTLPIRGERVEAMVFLVSRGGSQLYGKNIGTLRPKGVFIGFLKGLKWLEPIKGLSHLI